MSSVVSPNQPESWFSRAFSLNSKASSNSACFAWLSTTALIVCPTPAEKAEINVLCNVTSPVLIYSTPRAVPVSPAVFNNTFEVADHVVPFINVVAPPLATCDKPSTTD